MLPNLVARVLLAYTSPEVSISEVGPSFQPHCAETVALIQCTFFPATVHAPAADLGGNNEEAAPGSDEEGMEYDDSEEPVSMRLDNVVARRKARGGDVLPFGFQPPLSNDIKKTLDKKRPLRKEDRLAISKEICHFVKKKYIKDL